MIALIVIIRERVSSAVGPDVHRRHQHDRNQSLTTLSFLFPSFHVTFLFISFLSLSYSSVL